MTAQLQRLDEVPAWHAARHPARRALHFESEVLSYEALHARVAQAAGHLWHGQGVRPGDRVAWLGGNHAQQLVLLFALARLGAMLVPLNFRLAPAEWQRLLAASTPRLLVHDEAWREPAQALAQASGIAAWAEAGLRQAEAAPAPVHGSADSPVLLVYTSGTTGGPKGAVHTQANLLANMRIAAGVQRMAADDRILTVLPLFHVGGLCIQTLPALFAGAEVILHPRFEPGAALRAIRELRPTLTLLVPATMKAMIEHPQWQATDFASLRAVWAGSSVLPTPLVEAFQARGVPVCNVYGATETGPFSIALPPEHAFDHVGSCGWPAPGVEARLAEVRGGVGEVLLRAPNIVARYWPDLPATDAEGWFHTGDLAACAEDGSWRIVGRAKELIISGGENIHPAEVESALAEHPGVAECAAFGLPDAQWGEVVAVAVVRRAGAEAHEDALREHLAARLARYKLPRRWLWVQALPKTALGKVQRGELAKLASTSHPREAT